MIITIRNLRNFFLVTCLTAITFNLSAQVKETTKITISGYVSDGENGETLLGANVYVKELYKGGTTNEYGFYSLTLESGQHTLVASYIGYVSIEIPLTLTKDTSINIEIQSEAILADEVVISGERKDRNIESTEMSTVELQIEQVKAIPALFGEVDILKTIQLLPGVQSSGEGNTGFYVRGGGPDQNLILLDEAVVYNPGHMFGFFSIFNADAIKNFKLIKGGMPAKYGGRLSSVLEIAMRDGNTKNFQMDGGIGLISSRLTLQGPLKKNKVSYMISGRRTYIDILMKPISAADGTSYFFYDLNTKINFVLSDKDRLFLSGYFGRDVFDFRSPGGEFEVRIPWGNATATARWNHVFNQKLFMNMTFVYNNYDFGFNSTFNGFDFELFSGIRDFNAKMDFDFFPNINHNIKFGANYSQHKFTPYTASAETNDASFGTDPGAEKYAHEGAIYIQDDFNITDKLKANIGVRGSMFVQVGPYDQSIQDEFQRPVDTISYARGQAVKAYAGIEPRLALRYAINKKVSLKGSVTFSTQYIHSVSNATTTLPTDLWVPSTLKVKPQRGVQYALGYFQNFKENDYEASIEVYYKDLKNQIEFGQSYVPELNVDVEESFVFGNGYSYGAEFFIKKRTGKLNGWVGYTLSYTNKIFPDLNNGKAFPAKYDRRHDLSVVVIYEINDRWTVSSDFVLGSGQSITLPTGRYFVEGRVVNQYESRNGFRLATFHRLDFAATYQLKSKKKFTSELSFSIYNVYSRSNPFFIFFDTSGDLASGNVEVQAKQVSLFPILPSLTWNFKFK